MKTVSKSDFFAGKKIRGVSILPPFVLSLLGRLAARHNTDKYVTRYFNKLRRIKANECMSAEEILEGVRKAAAEAADVVGNFKAVSSAPGKPSDSKSLTHKDIRNERKTATENRIKAAGADSAMKTIILNNEEITRTDIVLHERLCATENKAYVKINALFFGIRKRKPVYDFNATTDEPYEVYNRGNKALDDMIKSLAHVNGDVNNDTNGGNNNDETSHKDS